MRSWLTLFVVGSVLGCGQGQGATRSGPVNGRSSTLVTVGSDLLVVANPDAGTIDAIWKGKVRSTPVGNEPTRLVARHNRLWATLRLDNTVVALQQDGETVVETDRRVVGSEPYGVVVSRDGKRLYVAVSIDNVVLELDAWTLETLHTYPIDHEPRWLALHPNDAILAVATARNPEIRFIDVEEHVVLTEPLELPVGRAGTPGRVTGDLAFSRSGDRLAIPMVSYVDPVEPLPGYYAPGSGPVVYPGIAIARMDADTGEPKSPGRQIDLTRYGNASHASHVAWDPSANAIHASIEGDRKVVTVRLGTESWPDPGYVSEAGAGPQGIAFTNDRQRWVHAAFEPAVTQALTQTEPIALHSPFPPQILNGRKLFYSTSSDSGVTRGGVGCASCHAEGRSDGHTWPLTTGDWQTPSLAGNVDATAPVSWAQDVGSVAEEAELTITGPMGGDGLPPADLEDLATYVNAVRLPNPPTPDATDETLEIGRAAFELAGCADCHLGGAFTDNQSYPLFELEVQTPTLRGIAASAPYLHDGRAETLEDVLQLAEGGKMGNPELLRPSERDALLAYLRSL